MLYLGMIRRQTSPITPFILDVTRRQVQLVHHVGDESRQVIFRQPVLQRGGSKNGWSWLQNRNRLFTRQSYEILPSKTAHFWCFSRIYLRHTARTVIGLVVAAVLA